MAKPVDNTGFVVVTVLKCTTVTFGGYCEN